MTLPDERLYAVIKTREFLRSLMDPSATPRVPREVRKQAYSCLRHYPDPLDMELVAHAAPARFAVSEGRSGPSRPLPGLEAAARMVDEAADDFGRDNDPMAMEPVLRALADQIRSLVHGVREHGPDPAWPSHHSSTYPSALTVADLALFLSSLPAEVLSMPLAYCDIGQGGNGGRTLLARAGEHGAEVTAD
ncbi:MAG: hypothetical protein IT285_16120 [Bdellovibrionales bacterium]|nr:hypothetical protein [Bdellovibrionales bacterium]